LAEARRSYAQADYRSQKKDDATAQKERAEAWERYGLVLERYRKLVSIGADDKSAEEVVGIFKEVGSRERMRLYEERLKAETPHWLPEGLAKLGEGWRRLDWKAKLGLSGVALGLGLAGGVPAAAATVGVVAMRIGSSLAAWQGTSRFLEAFVQGRREREAERAKADFLAQEVNLEKNMRVDDWPEKLQKKMAESHGRLDEELREMMRTRKRNAYIGAFMGSFVAFGGPGETMRSVADRFSDVLPEDAVGKIREMAARLVPGGWAERISDPAPASEPSLKASPDAAPSAELSHPDAPSMSKEDVIDQSSPEPKTPVPHSMETGDDVVSVESGSGKGIIQTLVEQRHMDSKEAARQVFNYAREHNIPIGKLDRIYSADVTFGPDGNIEDIRARFMPDHASHIHQRTEFPAYHGEDLPQPVERVGTAGAADAVSHPETPLDAAASSEAPTVPEASVGTGVEALDSGTLRIRATQLSGIFLEGPGSVSEGFLKGTSFTLRDIVDGKAQELSSVQTDRFVRFVQASREILGERRVDDMLAASDEPVRKTIPRIFSEVMRSGGFDRFQEKFGVEFEGVQA
jgi:hypothetical protein